MNLQVKRIASRFNEFYKDIIDLTDVNNEQEKNNIFFSRALAAYAIKMRSDILIENSANYVVDGYNDHGIDAVYCDDKNKRLVLVQAKWSNEANHSISQGDTSNFISGIDRIINAEFEGFNTKIRRMQNDIETAVYSMDYKIEAVIIYTSTQKLSYDCKYELEKIKSKINDGNDIFSYTVYSLADIYTSLSNMTNVNVTLENVAIYDWGTLVRNDIEIGYYGKLPIQILGEWWKKYNVELLSKNIRYYKGTTDVNDGIKKTLKNEPENFLLYNNGIKIIANKIKKAAIGATDRKMGVFTIDGASIVNGAQTTGSIGELYASDPSLCEGAYVMIQIINLEELPEGLNNSITKYSNTQNKIDSKDFVAMDSYQSKLQCDFALDGISYYYKSGDVTIDHTDKNCTIDDVAIAVGCSLNDISIVATIKGNYGKIYENIDKPPYKSIFNNSNSTYYIWNCVKIYKIFEIENNYYQKYNCKTNIDKLISIHGNRFILHYFLEQINKKYNLKDGYINNVQLDEIKNIIVDNLNNVVIRIKNIKEELYPEAYPANLFRNGKRCKDVYGRLVCEVMLNETELATK